MARLLAAAKTILFAGLLAGLATSLVQSLTTLPLLVAAESYEQGHHRRDGGVEERSHDSHAPVPLARTGGLSGAAHYLDVAGFKHWLLTATANGLVGVAFAMILFGCMEVCARFRGPAKESRDRSASKSFPVGLAWGLSGFAVFAAAPALAGLAAQPPGIAMAGLEARQLWWFFVVVLTALGLFNAVFAERLWLKGLGLGIMAIPLIVGGPELALVQESTLPPQYAAEFAGRSLGSSAVFWCALGLLCHRFRLLFAAQLPDSSNRLAEAG